MHRHFLLPPRDKSKRLAFTYREAVELKLKAPGDITFGEHAGVLYYCDPYFKETSNKATITVYTCNLRTKKHDSFRLSVPLTESVLQWHIGYLSVNDKHIALKSDSIYIFTRAGKLLKQVNSYKADEVHLVDDEHLLLLKNYNSHPLSDSVNTKIIGYNFKTGIIEKYLTPLFPYFLYTHLVRNHFSVKNNRLLFTQAMPYKIAEYSIPDLSLIDSINTDYIKNDATRLAKIDSIHWDEEGNPGESKRYCYELYKVDTFINRIEKVHFLDENTVMVTRRFPRCVFERRMIDVWKRADGHWRPVVEGQMYVTEPATEENYIITPGSFPLPLSYSTRLITTGNEIWLVNESAAPRMNITSQQARKEKDDYYSTHDLNYFVWVYNWQLK
ncbi:MAG: hypothetical protein KF744_16160 [Taibaiella sp.]|nr:hypothetical protein [Taibaiella sp.]